MADVITCSYCGVSQQKVDIEKYVEGLRAEVFGWVRSMVPGGIISSAQADPVARAQIFEHSIRQGLLGKFGGMSMQLIKIGSSPLLAPPYAAPSPSLGGNQPIDSRSMLGEAAKFQGLAPFAISEDQTLLLTQATVTAETLGYLTNIMRLYSDKQQRSYGIIAKNFEGAAESLGRDKSKTAGSARMSGLAQMCHAISSLSTGDVRGAGERIQTAQRYLTQASTTVLSQGTLISWFAGIKAELGMTDSLKSLVEGVRVASSSGAPATESFAKFGRYVSAFETAKKNTASLLSTGNFIDPDTFKEICTSFKDITSAKAGTGTVNILSGGGSIWVACWLADISYSFETGMLFMKKGQAVQERLLISGVFPLSPGWVMNAPESLVIDIFSVRSDSGFLDRIKGNEKSLTTGLGYSYLGQIGKKSLTYTASVVPVLSTKLEAEKLTNIYLEKVRQKLQGKLRIGIPTISQLVYVGGSIRNGRLCLSGLPEEICPYVGDEEGLRGMSL